jgi:transcriptional regulator with PAS, ATPase and Fis domain
LAITLKLILPKLMKIQANVVNFDDSCNLIVGMSEAALRLGALIRRVGNSDVPVLIQGESGTGKELVARSIFGMRPAGEFVAVDCATLSAGLVESELFGHQRGAFTGALEGRTGLLQMADGGTAFFDEIGELPLEAQVKLLRVLQQKEIRPVGSNRTLPCNFRVIAATNRNLAEEVEKGRFRLDLLYRLNVVMIPVPPLRERKDDIPCLVRHFLDKWADGYEITPELAAAFQLHHWPGNIRELENCVARLIALSSDGALHAEDLSFATGPTRAQVVSMDRSSSGIARLASAVGNRANMSVEAAERAAIERAMTEARGSTSVAAKTLGIGRTTLYRRLKHYDEMRLHA